jgi:predicted RNase H-like HicB family nuclease
MKLNIVYKKEKEWFIGHIQEYPDYESQGKTLDELKENLIEIFNDINKGLVPDAEPFQLLEVAIWKEKNWLKQLSQTVVFSYAMVVIMTGIKILNQEKANQSQGILK